MLNFFNFLIRWSFYLLFFLVPIVFTGNTSELFEFNKMWLTFGLTIIIAASWIGKMIIERQVRITKSPLTIPIVLFLLSQIVSTIFSIDPHTSLWGYYSRFNGGLLSLLSYGFLYFAFISNISPRQLMRYVYTLLASGVVVALWGLPSHFGYDPTCLVFRGTFDVSCWTFAFQPKVRIFSTLGQPDWLAAYLVYLLPLSMSLNIIFAKAKNKLLAALFFILTSLFYTDLLFTKARSGFLGFAVSIGIFALVYIAFEWKSFIHRNLTKAIKSHSAFLLLLAGIVVVTFFIGSPISQLDRFSLNGVQQFFAAKKITQASKTPNQVAQATSAIPTEELGGTDSGKIRLFVWKGALEIFLHNPLFGTGVETFAYSYYQYRPAGHNLTSEWDYLYNKAHNEYLNYLATTGAFGFLTYMAVILISLWIMANGLIRENRKLKIGVENSQSKIEKYNHPQSSTFKNLSSIIGHPSSKRLLLLALLAAYISILVTNFFGFSVVIMNIFLFLTPALALFLLHQTDNAYSWPARNTASQKVTEIGWIGIGVIWLIACYLLLVLSRFYLADISYAYGQNLDNANDYQAAYSYLHDAVNTRPSEPTFQNELTINDAVLAAALFQQKDTANGTKLRDEALAVSDKLVTNHPNVVTFWKTRVRVLYTLAQTDPQYLRSALQSIQKASQLAPTDAKVWYNLGLLYDQTGDVDHAIAALKQTMHLKIDYRDAYYALALFYRQKAVGGTGKTVTDSSAEKNAVDTLRFILANFGPNDDLKIRDTLKSWGEE